MVYGVAYISINFEAWAVLMATCLLKKDSKAMNTDNIRIAPQSLLPLPENDDTLIRRSDLPRYIPVAKQTWARWAVEGRGPRFVKLGGRLVAYRAGDLKEWLQGQVRENTSQDSSS